MEDFVEGVTTFVTMFVTKNRVTITVFSKKMVMVTRLITITVSLKKHEYDYTVTRLHPVTVTITL